MATLVATTAVDNSNLGQLGLFSKSGVHFRALRDFEMFARAEAVEDGLGVS